MSSNGEETPREEIDVEEKIELNDSKDEKDEDEENAVYNLEFLEASIIYKKNEQENPNPTCPLCGFKSNHTKMLNHLNECVKFKRDLVSFYELEIQVEKQEDETEMSRAVLNFEKGEDKTPLTKYLPTENLITSLLEPEYQKVKANASYYHSQLRNMLHILDDEVFYYEDREIHVHNRKTRENSSTETLKSSISSIGCTPGYFAYATQFTIFIYTYPEKKLIYTEIYRSMVNQIFFTWYSGDLHMIVPINNGVIYFYSIRGNDVIFFKDYYTDSYVNTISVSRDGTYFALAPDNGELSVIYTDTLKLYHTFNSSSDDPFRLDLSNTKGAQFDCCSFNTESTMVAVCGSDYVFVFDLVHKTNLFKAKLSECHLCKFSPFSGNVLAILGDQELGILYIDDEFIHFEKLVLFDDLNSSAGLSFSYDGSKLYTISDQVMCEFNINKKFTNWTLKMHESFLLNHDNNIYFSYK